MRLPQKQTLPMLQTSWASILEPIINNPLSNPIILQSVSLTSGANSINHKLGRKLQGWFITRQRGVTATFYDTQDSNPTPELTLNLMASTAVTVDLAVF